MAKQLNASLITVARPYSGTVSPFDCSRGSLDDNDLNDSGGWDCDPLTSFGPCDDEDACG